MCQLLTAKVCTILKPHSSGTSLTMSWKGVVYNVFEAVDVITLIKGGVYDDLNLEVGEVLKKRSPVSTKPYPSELV